MHVTRFVQSPVLSTAKIGLTRNSRVGEFSHNSNCNDDNVIIIKVKKVIIIIIIIIII